MSAWPLSFMLMLCDICSRSSSELARFTVIVFHVFDDQAWVGGFSNLMDEFRAFMAGRPAPFRLNGLRAIFITPEDEVDEDKVSSVFRGLTSRCRSAVTSAKPRVFACNFS